MKLAKPGEELEILAHEWNTVRQERPALDQKFDRHILPQSEHLKPDCYIYNDSGADRKAGDMLAIWENLYLPDENPDAWIANRWFKGIRPSFPRDQGKLVMLAENIDYQDVGLGYSRGIHPVKLKRDIDVLFGWCDAGPDPTHLEERPNGSAQVIWRGPTPQMDDPGNPGTDIDDPDALIDALIRLGPPRDTRLSVVADVEITPGNEALCTYWKMNAAGTGREATDYKIMARLDWLHGNKNIAADKQLGVDWVAKYSQWLIRQAECP